MSPEVSSSLAKVSIAADTGMGAVHLAVTDGEPALRFYRDTLGLAPLPSSAGGIRLGVDSQELVVLHPGAAAPVAAHTSGLYHLALVVPNRRELARVIGRLHSQRSPNSPTDHVITKSDYLWDPDGNGIEVYAETPEDGTWTYAGDSPEIRDNAGRLRSGRDAIDLDQLFAELQPGDRLDGAMPAGTRMGHVHLHVRDLDEALNFYHRLIGFDVMGVMRDWGAAFISAGGYHHHLGLNTWAGVGASPAPPDHAGLRYFTIELPTPGDRDEVTERLRSGGVQLTSAEGDSWVEDPSKNRLRLAVRQR